MFFLSHIILQDSQYHKTLQQVLYVPPHNDNPSCYPEGGCLRAVLKTVLFLDLTQ